MNIMPAAMQQICPLRGLMFWFLVWCCGFVVLNCYLMTAFDFVF